MVGRSLVLLLLLALTACTAEPAGQSTPKAVATMDELVSWMREKTGSCTEVRRGTPEEFAQFAGRELTPLYQPYIAEWASCSLSSEYPMVGMVLFGPGKFPEFQKNWRDAMTAGRLSEGPTFSFGKGFAVTQGYLGVSKLDLYYFRCHYDDPKVHQIPADVEGCVFANPEHGHKGH